MVGRTAELARLQSLLDGATGPTVALISGEGGIGKTRLVRELVRGLPAGVWALAGQADGTASSGPLALALDALGSVPPPEGTEDLQRAAADPSRPAEDRIRAAVDLLRRHVDHGCRVIVLDDLHWADAESIAVLERLAEPSGAPVLLVGTFRPGELSRRHPLGEALPRLERRHGVTRIHLERLSTAEVGDFLAAAFEQEPTYRVVEALHERSGGNPFFLEELVASTSAATAQALADAPLPWSVAEIVGAQVEALSPEVRRIVTAASVLGRRVGFDLLAAVTGTEEGELIELLRAAVDAGLLVEEDDDLFAFHHDLAREAVEAGLLGRERRRLHEAALEALDAMPRRDRAAIVRHARGAGRFDVMVDEARIGAAEALALGSTYQALQLAEIGLTEADHDLPLLATATRAAWMTDLLEEAAAHAERWRDVARSLGDAAEEAAALGLRMRIAYDLGDIATLTQRTEELAALVDRLEAPEVRARAMADLAQSYALRDLAEPTLEWAERALALADEHHLDDVGRAAQLERAALLLYDPETVDEGRKLLEEVADGAAQAGDHVLAAQALISLVWYARQSSRVEEARALVERVRQHAEAAGFDRVIGYARVEAVALLKIVKGQLDQAIRVLDDGDAGFPARSRSRARRWLAVLRAGLALEAGELDDAATFTELAKPATARSRAGIVGLDLHLALRRGELAEARRLLAELVDALRADGVSQPGQVHDLVAAGVAAGLRPEELAPLAERVGYLAGQALPDDHPWPRLIRAQLAEAEGDHETALSCYEHAASCAEVVDIVARHRATAHVGAARCAIALGRLDDAAVHARAARPLLAGWRGWRVEELEAVERRLGLGAPQSGPEELTPREREVAALLAEGLTNAQLAERLFISPRTAAVHVSNILAKLGLRSRAEVAAWAVRAGLVSES